MLAFGNRHFAPEGASVDDRRRRDRRVGRADRRRPHERPPPRRAGLRRRRRVPRRAQARARDWPRARRGVGGLRPRHERRRPSRAARAPAGDRTTLLLEGPILATLLQPRLAEHAGDGRAGLDRPYRDLLGVAARVGCARRHGAGVSRLHDDGHAVGRRGRRRHRLGGRARARRRPPRRRRRARAARARHQSRPGACRPRRCFSSSAARSTRRWAARARSLDAALAYSNVVFAGNMLLWVMNAFASVIRGSGVMQFPSLVICIGVALLIPLSPLFIFGVGPAARLGDRRRRRGRRLHDRADGGAARLVRRLRQGPGAAAAARGCAAICSPISCASARSGARQHAADDVDGGDDDRPRRRRGGARRRRGLRHRRAARISADSRWCSASARRWWRWSARTSAPAGASGLCGSR